MFSQVSVCLQGVHQVSLVGVAISGGGGRVCPGDVYVWGWVCPGGGHVQGVGVSGGGYIQGDGYPGLMIYISTPLWH